MTSKEQALHAQKAGRVLAGTSIDVRNQILYSVATAIDNSRITLLTENAADVARAKETDLAAVLLKRLELSDRKIDQMIEGLRDLADLPDPLGHILRETELDEGLTLRQVAVPIGLIGIIFESRPDALVQIAGLCIKSGNAVILKGGSEAARTNLCLHGIVVDAIGSVNAVLADAVQHVASREAIQDLLSLDDVIDLMIPRGSGELVKTIKENTRIPVLGHTEGVCHLYVDREADLEQAVELTYDSKCEYPAVCNAIETLLVHQAIAADFLPLVARRLNEVELRGDKESRRIVPEMAVATQDDWTAEYNDLVLAVRVVASANEAIEHINTYGSHHTDAVATTDRGVAEEFMSRVDSSSVMWNCSTRFADGFRYGFGAEVGISTNKIHARGPVGLEGMTIYKYTVVGDGHCVADYSSGRRRFTHRGIKP